MDFSPSTWHALGMSVAYSYLGLGCLAIGAPALAAKTFGIWPAKEPTGGSKASVELANHISAARTSMLLVGVRDLAVAAAIATFGYQRNLNAMGVVTLSSMVLCVPDIIQIWKVQGPLLGSGSAVGGVFWFLIGYGLIQQ